MNASRSYDVAIVGGGLAGLALSIQLSKQGHRVILFEKEQYPFHKVCGEYISLESWNFLTGLGVDLDALHLPVISKLQVSSPNGKLLTHTLPLGGFGISRYTLDNTLAQIAKTAGVTVMENTKVTDIEFANDAFTVYVSKEEYSARMVCGSFGKRSNIDIKLKRPFILASKNKLNNYIGVKYHVRSDFPADTIALHNFKNGYCGIVKIEQDIYNLCYLTTAANLKNADNDIEEMERSILHRNPHLKKIWEQSTMLFTEPLTISQISFDKKRQTEDHVLMIGDAAGMITPLCGNGMSMALHGSKIATAHIHAFLQQKISREEMEKQYTLEWNRQFAHRLLTGRRIQRLFGSTWLSALFISIMKMFPGMAKKMIRQTHGKPF